MNIQGILKALAPSVLAASGVVTDWVASGHFNQPSLRLIAAGAVTSVVVYFVPNTPKAAPVEPPVMAQSQRFNA